MFTCVLISFVKNGSPYLDVKFVRNIMYFLADNKDHGDAGCCQRLILQGFAEEITILIQREKF
jgi:hypothetical protein